ncbi:MAG: fatty acid desaturase [Gammaproteobacteria bacterium]
MSKKATQPIDLGRPNSVRILDEKKAAFIALTTTPKWAMPTIMLAVFTILPVLLINLLCVLADLPLWVGLLTNAFIYYFFFSVMHDSAHSSISSTKWINDWIGQVALSIFSPFSAMTFFKWAHMEHHRFTNDHDKDPDIWSHGSLWLLPFRWMSIDLYYGWRAIKWSNPQTKKVLKDSLPFMIGGCAFLIAVVALGYGVELVMLWLIPSRLGFIGMGYAFFWLPHAHWPNPGRNLKQSDNFTLATLVRTGGERILTPLLQYQNHHLIHHLWPTTPFYNNAKLWHLLEDEIRERDLAEVHGLQIQPTYNITSNQQPIGAS